MTDTHTAPSGMVSGAKQAHPDRSVHLGQFRLTRLQVVNWGTFCGYKDLLIDERGVLFTGPSGSGKSSLLDGHSVALLPTRDQRFNASADLTAKGAKQSTRNNADYVRGAWSENDDEHGQSQVRYLRGGKPTWSAIGATYDDGLGSATTGIVVKWFTGTDTDGSALKTMHILHAGTFDLTALEGWAQRKFDLKWLKRTFPEPDTIFPPTEADYTRGLSKRVGLGISKIALSLLGKAKAMKNVGDLNLFIRENMLDEPDTFAKAKTMVEMFQPLNQAFETAERAYAQQQVLSPVPGNWDAYQKAKAEAELAIAMQGTPVDHYLRGIHLIVLAEETARIDQEAMRLGSLLEAQVKEADDAHERYRSLDDQLRKEGEALTELERSLKRASDERDARAKAYGSFSGHVAKLENVTCPTDRSGFDDLHRRLPDLRSRYTQRLADLKPGRRDASAAAGETGKKLRERAEALTTLLATGSMIPLQARQRRDHIASGTNVPVAELAYAAELIDIAAGQERWRPAAEKVLRSFGLRLLVPERYKDAVKTFIDTHDMGGIVEYSVVTAISAHQPRPDPGTLAGKLTVDHGHASGPWLAGQVARQFEHVCVETARELEPHALAVTVNGTVKLRGNHYRKDDRPELTRPSSYILGANTAAKIAALEHEVAALTKAKEGAEKAADEIDRQWEKLSKAVEAADQVAASTAWSELDYWESEQTANGLRRRIEDIKNNDVNLRELTEQCDAAKLCWTDLVGDAAQTKRGRDDLIQRGERLAGERERESARPYDVASDHRAYLDSVLEGLGVAGVPERMPEIRERFAKDLAHRKREADQDQKVCVANLQSAVNMFLDKWREYAPDDSGEVERCGGDFAALHEEITRRRLPEAMAKFQKMISEDMVPSISILCRTIETSTSQIRRRVDTVNKGLQRVEFNPGTHLQIAATARKFAAGEEFRKIVDVLLQHGVARKTKDSFAQFNRVRDLMARFTADNAESRRWRETVLDVRLSFTFHGREDTPDGTTVTTYRNTATGSGGEQEKLVAFCLAAALSYNLADDTTGGRPRFAPLMLDEAFSKSDETFASQALAAFDEFGFQLLIAAPIRMSGVLEPFIGQAILVEKRVTSEGARSNAASATFGELAIRSAAEADEAGDAAA